MKLVGIMPCRNESWIIEASVRAAFMWCDDLVILDHASTDETNGILQRLLLEYPGRATLIRIEDPIWSEMQHRQELLDEARARKATHVAIVDADEILTGNLLPNIRNYIEILQPGETLQVGMLAMWRALDYYRVDTSIWSNRYDLTLAFADAPALAWRTTNGYDHHHREPHGSFRKRLDPLPGGVMHLQWCSWRRLKAKHARYKMDERLKYPQKPIAEIDRMYSLALDERGLNVQLVPESYWKPYEHLRKYIDLEAEPWQEQQCRDWIAEHGKEKFAGLDLFGVV